jgi:hypothetical protein
VRDGAQALPEHAPDRPTHRLIRAEPPSVAVAHDRPLFGVRVQAVKDRTLALALVTLPGFA